MTGGSGERMAVGNTGGGDVIASLPKCVCLKIGKGVLFVKLFLVNGLSINYPAPAPEPEDPNLVPDGRDPGPESGCL